MQSTATQTKWGGERKKVGDISGGEWIDKDGLYWGWKFKDFWGKVVEVKTEWESEEDAVRPVFEIENIINR